MEMLGALILPHISGRYGDARSDHQRLGGILKAHGADAGGRCADPDQPCRLDGFGELGILRQKAIARMDRGRARLLRRGENFLRDKVAFAGGGRSDAHRLVRLAHEGHSCVDVAMDCDRANAQASGGADDPAGDLAPVGDKKGLDHHYILNRPKRARSGIGALSAAAKARPRTSRVWAGSMIPSSQSLAVA